MENYKVYLIRDSKKNIVYCGITYRSLKQRFDEHKYSKRLDDSYSIELVTENLTVTQAAEIEKRLIEQYNLTKTGLNRSLGSINGHSQLHTQEMKEKWSKERAGKKVNPEHALKNKVARLGKKNSEEHTQILRNRLSKKIICNETNIIYDSINQCASKIGLCAKKISAVCTGVRKHHRNYTFKFYNETVEIDGNNQSTS